MADMWQTVTEACHTLGISQRTLYRRIEKGELESKLEGNRRLVLVDDSQEADGVANVADATDTALLQQVQSEKTHLREQVKALQEELSQTSERHDTIVLQLTRQLETQQRLLEYHQDPWYRRWFRKKQEEG